MFFNAVARARTLNIVNELHGRWNGSPLTFFVRRESTTLLSVNYIPAAAVKKITSTPRTTCSLPNLPSDTLLPIIPAAIE